MAGFALSGSSGLGHQPVCASLTLRPPLVAPETQILPSLPARKTRTRPVVERSPFGQEIFAVGEGRA
jgi:hypothetical protein